MPKEEWGTKRLCPTTGKRFYDLKKTPVVSPYTGEVVNIETGKASRINGKPNARMPICRKRRYPVRLMHLFRLIDRFFRGFSRRVRVAVEPLPVIANPRVEPGIEQIRD